MQKYTLYQYNSEDIRIHIQVYFENGNLIVDGYDIGKRVEEYWGDSDYEYSTTISENEVKKLFSLMNIKDDDKEGLLKAIADTYNTNTCYSEFIKFLEKNGIKSEGFSWA